MYAGGMDIAPNNAFFTSEPGERAPPGPLALMQAFANTVAAEGTSAGRRSRTPVPPATVRP